MINSCQSPGQQATVHMGYSKVQKGYLLLDLRNKSFFTSRDVVFKEDYFPFAEFEEGHVLESMFVDTLSRDDILLSSLDQSEQFIPSNIVEDVLEGRIEMTHSSEVTSSSNSSEVVIDVMEPVPFHSLEVYLNIKDPLEPNRLQAG
ncbi:hypothetical protein AABB24_039937 [Solanum stoloniferum]|uniref:Retroviral polymerase SH3-like domain-containing protein n=1 Tax=Solanum stoloniferum TaxID=62892 RepID=A0ABD2QST4_9SOLN